MVSLCYRVNESSYGDRDHYIGLKRGDMDCACAADDMAACEQCRLSWQWQDDKRMRFNKWVEEGDRIEPHADGDCGRMTPIGWAERSCSAHFRYICKRQVRNVLITNLTAVSYNMCGMK